MTSNTIGIKLLYLIILNLGCLFSSETLTMCIYLLFLKWFRFLGQVNTVSCPHHLGF